MKQITAEHCARIRPYLPVQRGNVRIPNIVVINAILHVMENGCKSRALPEGASHFLWFELVCVFPFRPDSVLEGCNRDWGGSAWVNPRAVSEDSRTAGGPLKRWPFRSRTATGP